MDEQSGESEEDEVIQWRIQGEDEGDASPHQHVTIMYKNVRLT